MIAAAGSGGHTLYDVLVVMHVVAVVLGFGSVAVSGAYGGIGYRYRPGEDLGDLRRFFSSSSWVEYLLPLGPAFGVAAMAVRPQGSEFGQLWAVSGVAFWIAASVLFLSIIRPAERNLRSAVLEGPAESIAVPGRRLLWASVATDVLFAASVLLMVTQPA